MNLLFIEYPKCSTCQKAKTWLDDNGVTYIDHHIVENNPNIKELQQWVALSGKPLKSFFNTSGLLYKSLGLKDKLPTMSEAEQYKLLASNGMLVKRPLLIGDNFAFAGFRPTEWLQKL